jgi:hypothetical protein
MTEQKDGVQSGRRWKMRWRGKGFEKKYEAIWRLKSQGRGSKQNADGRSLKSAVNNGVRKRLNSIARKVKGHWLFERRKRSESELDALIHAFAASEYKQEVINHGFGKQSIDALG